MSTPDATYKHHRESLFASIDVDNSGQIDKNEFGKLYEQIKAEIETELSKERALEKTAESNQRKFKVMSIVAGVVFAVLAVSIAANCGLMFLVVDSLKDTELHSGVMTARDQSIVSTGGASEELDILTLPALNDTATYNALGPMINLVDHNSKPMSRRLEGWKWHSESRMDLMLSNGEDLVIADGQAFHIRPSGVVFWESGAPVESNSNAAAGSLVSEAQAKCEAVTCPLSACVVSIATAPIAATCKGTEVWNYKDEADSAERRKLVLPILVGVVVRVVVRQVIKQAVKEAIKEVTSSDDN